MKQKNPYLRKIGTMLCAIAVCVLTVGTISVYALVGGTDISAGKETKTATERNVNIDFDFADNYNDVITPVRFEKKPENTTTTKSTTTKKTKAKATTTQEITTTTVKKVTATAAETTLKKTTAKPATNATAKITTAKATKKTTTAKETQTNGINYTDAEFEMMCYVIQNEAGNLSSKSKIAVSNVIINRVKSSRFANSISGVLTAQGQFSAINNYYNKTNPPSQNTKECVRRALNGEDYSNGALFYYAPRYCSGSSAAWFESLTFCMELEGQRFFK